MKRKVYQIGPSLELKGGISTVIYNLSNSEDLNLNYDLINIKSVGKYKLITFIKSIFRSINIENDSIVHFHVASNGSFIRKYILFKLINKHSKKIIHIHGGGFIEFYQKTNNIMKSYIRDMINNCDKIISVSNYMTEELNREFPSIDTKISMIYNGIEIKNITINWEDKKNVILFMGRIVEYKGIYNLIDVIKNIKYNLKKEKWIVKIAGDGEVEKVKDIIKEKNLEDLIQVVGWVDGEKKENIIKESKIFIMPSHVESFGIAAVEAMNYGNVIVCSDVGGLPEIVKSENGYVVKNNSIEEYCKVLNHLIKNNNEMREISQRNIKKSEEFSLEKMFSNLIKEYENL
ncbi:glycosyltransferase family 4 protein [Clostridium perfringens]|uniref:glycosyltransferase family 4 protein n=1 Tax=Clostridium perfringens TaxID=1502 RepID=UPI0039EAD507